MKSCSINHWRGNMDNPIVTVAIHFNEIPEVNTTVQIADGMPTCYVMHIGPATFYFTNREMYLTTIDKIKSIAIEYWDVQTQRTIEDYKGGEHGTEKS
jgi:hypothetical protein